MKKIKCFVTFLSPGTMISEQTTLEIEDWCHEKAVEMSSEIKERNAATPYGFYFTTRARTAHEFDSKEIERSGIFHIGGEILSIEDIKNRGRESDSILLSNMQTNGWNHVVKTNNSYLHVAVLKEDDIVLEK